MKQKSLKKKEREWWQVQPTYGLALAVRQEAEQRKLKLLAEKMETPTGRRVLAKQLRQSHPKEYRGDLIGGSQERNFKTTDPNGLQVLKCRVSVRRHFRHPSSFQGRGCENGRSTEDPASES